MSRVWPSRTPYGPAVDWYMSRQDMYRMEVTLTELRKDLFRLVDQAVATGEPLIVRRKGQRVVLRAQAEAAPEELTPSQRVDRYLALVEAEGPDPMYDLTQADIRAQRAEMLAEIEAEWDDCYGSKPA